MDIFWSMKDKYQVSPNKEHYACVVDLLCRAGKVDEAYELLKRMPMRPTESIIGAFFNGCTMHQRRDLARQMVKDLETDLIKPGTFVTLSNICAAEEKWREAQNVRKLMKGCRVYKEPGFSLVDRGNGSTDFKLIEARKMVDLGQRRR